MAEVTGIRTTFEVSVDVAAMYASQQTVDPAALLALVGSLMEEGYGVVLWRELLAFRDLCGEVDAAHDDMGSEASMIRYGLAAYRQRGSQGTARVPQ